MGSSMFPPQFQIVSDLHLETPLLQPSYKSFKLSIRASNLCLLGDIGLVRDAQFFLFLENLLESSPNLKIFFVLGNHEAYGLTLEIARQKLNNFSEEIAQKYGVARFIFLHRTRHDINAAVTVLGCSLWTRIPCSGSTAAEARKRLTDFNEERGIIGRTLESHNADHIKDLEWLNEQVRHIEQSDPSRHIVILTHHCPTVDPRASDPAHANSDTDISAGFATDLRGQRCWESPSVKMWAFGHTHFNCEFSDDREEGIRKLVIANQGGYNELLDGNEGVRRKGSRLSAKVVEARGQRWVVMTSGDSTEKISSREAIKTDIGSKSSKIKSPKSGISRLLARFRRTHRD